MSQTYKMKTVVARKGRDGVRENVPVNLKVTVDWDALASVLGAKAFKNRSGKTVLLNGLMVVRAKEAANG